MKLAALTMLVAGVLALLPALVQAQDGDGGSRGALIRIDGDVTVPANESFRTVVVVNGDARVDGTVRDLVVVRGNAVVAGIVENNVFLVDGDLTLTETARVQDVHLVRGELLRDQGATVTGHISRRQDFRFWPGAAAVFSVFLWAGLSVAVIAGGLVFAAIGGRQLGQAARSLTADAGRSILGAVCVWVGLPALAVLLMVTVVGIPLGVGLLLFILPVLGFLGYIVAGARLGTALIGFAGRSTGEHPYSATFLGLLIFQLVLLVPVLGFLICLVAGLWGAGGLALSAWRAARGTPAGPAAPPTEPVAAAS